MTMVTGWKVKDSERGPVRIMEAQNILIWKGLKGSWSPTPGSTQHHPKFRPYFWEYLRAIVQFPGLRPGSEGWLCHVVMMSSIWGRDMMERLLLQRPSFLSRNRERVFFPTQNVGTLTEGYQSGKMKATFWPLPSSAHSCFIYPGVSPGLSQKCSLGPLRLLNVITASPLKITYSSYLL